ncbi:hypothetical protein L1887_50172 [Cichorium endivia]|nr:hypothetical protein L1887_50172 [Cichorium endivia]
MWMGTLSADATLAEVADKIRAEGKDGGSAQLKRRNEDAARAGSRAQRCTRGLSAVKARGAAAQSDVEAHARPAGCTDLRTLSHTIISNMQPSISLATAQRQY